MQDLTPEVGHLELTKRATGRHWPSRQPCTWPCSASSLTSRATARR